MTYFDYNGREWNKEANILDNLAEWKPMEQPFYLELYGETSPLVDEAYAKVVPDGVTDPKATADAPGKPRVGASTKLDHDGLSDGGVALRCAEQRPT